MENPFKSIYKFNKDAGLLSKPYSDFLEPSFLIEEALEDLPRLQILTNITNAKSNSPKDIARQLVIIAGGEDAELTDLQRFDKHIDAIVYAVGGAYKLGLTPQQLEAGIAVVMHSAFKKIGCKKDDQGKLGKPDNWPEIEAEQTKKLQAILDKRA